MLTDTRQGTEMTKASEYKKTTSSGMVIIGSWYLDLTLRNNTEWKGFRQA